MKWQALERENSLKQPVCCSSVAATQVVGLTPVQEAVVAVFRFAHWTRWLLQCSLATMLSGAVFVCLCLCLCVCIYVCLCMNGPEASIGVAACPTDVCWMDKSTHNPLGLAAGSSHGPFLLLSSLFFCPLFPLRSFFFPHRPSLFHSSHFSRFFSCVFFV